MTWTITPERLAEFRNQLRKEMGNPTLWYIPTKSCNKDVVIIHPECPYKYTKSGKVAEHRYIWWLHNKDNPIRYNDVIHHINGNHQDNRIENLEKLKRKQHKQSHKKMRKNRNKLISAIQKIPKKEPIIVNIDAPKVKDCSFRGIGREGYWTCTDNPGWWCEFKCPSFANQKKKCPLGCRL